MTLKKIFPPARKDGSGGSYSTCGCWSTWAYGSPALSYTHYCDKHRKEYERQEAEQRLAALATGETSA